jgi:lipopolysaccharide/colanic/teichoic acid biosynthesis glycosyltransferase
LLASDNVYARHNLERLYQHVLEAAAAKPVCLTVAQPLVKQTFADRVYDYFFSVYFLMILGDFFCFAVIALIIRLEKKGVVHRYGVEEDANR